MKCNILPLQALSLFNQQPTFKSLYVGISELQKYSDLRHINRAFYAAKLLYKLYYCASCVVNNCI